MSNNLLFVAHYVRLLGSRENYTYYMVKLIGPVTPKYA